MDGGPAARAPDGGWTAGETATELSEAWCGGRNGGCGGLRCGGRVADALHRRLWWLGYRDAAQMAGVGPGAVTVAASLAAWLPGPAALALSAVALRVPVWLAWYWLVRRG